MNEFVMILLFVYIGTLLFWVRVGNGIIVLFGAIIPIVFGLLGYSIIVAMIISVIIMVGGWILPKYYNRESSHYNVTMFSTK